MFNVFRNFWENFKEYIILIFLLLISLFFLSINENQSIKKLKTLVFGSFAFVTYFVADITSISDIKNENVKLREQNSRLMLDYNRFIEYGIENEELKNLLKLKDTSNYSLVASKIISRTNALSQGIFTINSGTKDSIKPGMAVITGEGLVGLVYQSSKDYSVVRTLENVNLKIVAKNQRSRYQGILRWSGSDLIVTNLPKTADVKIGDKLIVSDLSSILNLPIPIGIAVKIVNPEKGYFNDVIVKPFVNFVKVENVFVVKVVSSKVKNNIELNFYNLKSK